MAFFSLYKPFTDGLPNPQDEFVTSKAKEIQSPSIKRESYMIDLNQTTKHKLRFLGSLSLSANAHERHITIHYENRGCNALTERQLHEMRDGIDEVLETLKYRASLESPKPTLNDVFSLIKIWFLGIFCKRTGYL